MIRRLLLASALGLHAQPVPLEVTRDGSMILTLQALADDGSWRPLRMKLDTGATATLLDHRSAPGLITGFFKQQEVSGFAGRKRPVLQRTLRRLRCGGAEQGSVPVEAMDLRYVNRRTDHPVDGLLGMSFLRGRRFTVDVARRELVWEGLDTGGRVIPFLPRPGDPRPWIPLTLQGRTRPALADTGCGPALVVTEDGPATSDCELASGVDGTRRIKVGLLPGEVFGQAFPPQGAALDTLHTILGCPLLLAARTTFDFRQGELRLEEVEGRLPFPEGSPISPSRPFVWNRDGKEPFLEVLEGLPRCHPWYQAGFRAGDRLLRAGDLEGSELCLDAIHELMKRKAAVEWQVRRGNNTLILWNPEGLGP